MPSVISLSLLAVILCKLPRFKTEPSSSMPPPHLAYLMRKSRSSCIAHGINIDPMTPLTGENQHAGTMQSKQQYKRLVIMRFEKFHGADVHAPLTGDLRMQENRSYGTNPTRHTKDQYTVRCN